MKIYHTIPDNKNLFKNPVVTIGNFDGVHRGHQKIFEKLLSIAREKEGDPVVITFSSHPRKVLNPEAHIRIITTSDEKVNAVFAMGIDNIIFLHFTPEMADMSAREFYDEILLKKIDSRALVIGYDHAFGKNREGNIDFLEKLSSESGIEVTRVEEELLDGEPISSSRIRGVIERGDMDTARNLLGRFYSLTGDVMRGAGRGAGLGFPTANIRPHDPDKIIPPDGVYAVAVSIEDRLEMPGMLNIGTNPTFGENERTIEVNIFDFSENLYDAVITVHFHGKIRDEIAFSSADQLVEQIKKDKQNVIRFLGES
jgi:riboflavin kinase/FMN adenylyltransferase